ncbi:tetraacyldisaccharide 4'-kinase [Mailhella massiliensis]|uniref:Tetraacyldisaccharide 4'-kinase n=1 Tax=Mailhella massiliensis TaxID=1903261 RepID=A0A921AV82_9BACT|nr:tetraacyldisaccharide 4'-kinase [Mailhella massiliensis]HJD96526.1 tetraacyldisaccharide 4'-kinase [Mailhella massiliensis]
MAKRHPLQNLLFPLLLPFSMLYGLGGLCRRALARRGTAKSWKPSRPCVSVGNISWGGTGKTPVTDWLLSHAERKGLRAAVLTRGYGARPSCLPLRVETGMDASECGDEPLMLAMRHPGAVVMVDPDRNRAGRLLERDCPPDLYLLDDGFQHLSTGRDLDLVLLDKDDVRFRPAPGRPPSNWNRIIPAGSWREPVSALNDAGAFLIKAEPSEWPELVPALKERLRGFPRPVFAFCMEPSGLRPVGGCMDTPLVGASAVKGPYAFLCGIGDPSQALHTVVAFLGRAPEKVLAFPDHHDFSGEAESLRSLGLPVVCTGKDSVKLASLSLPLPCFSLEVSARFFASLGGGEDPAADFETWWEAWLGRHVPSWKPEPVAR